MKTLKNASPLLLLAVLIAVSQSVIGADAQLTVLPQKVQLDGQATSHRLLILDKLDGEMIGVPTDKIVLTSSDEAIVRVEGSTLVASGNGQATVTATVGNRSTTIPVMVSQQGADVDWSFRNHVLPILSRTGCNSGACHGALAGKGGFRLSLRGYDPKSDHYTITRQARGRRIELSDPGRSLVLAKPSGGIAHKGGLRFETGSADYKVLADWISAGASAPRDDDAQLTNVEVLPSLSRLKVGAEQPLLVRAHYSDGRIEDVTRWAIFASANEAVVKVDDHGIAHVIGHGEGAVTAWFSSKIALARITSPFEHEVPDTAFTAAGSRNFIDELVLKQLRRLNLKPSPPASDAEFLRRVYLDTIGTLPTTVEVREFQADTAKDKRDREIEQLLERPEFVDYWTYKWSDLLLVNGTLLRPEAVKAYYMWIRKQVEANTPWDQFVQQIVTAQGSSIENGATNFYALHQDPESMTENVSQAFLGLSIACAKCHNHPLEKWTNDQYYAMANIFARVRAKGWGGDSRSGDGKRTLYVVPRGDLLQPLTGKPQPPTPLDGEPIAFDDTKDRRVHLAKWLTDPANPYFARAIANRVWANFMAVGLVEQVDDLRVSNPASNEELLSALAEHLADHDFDLKQLMRSILQSKTYQRSSRPLPENEDDKRFYARYYPRRMMAEVLLDAISQVTDVPSNFTEVAFPGGDKRKTDFYPKGTRALQLYDSAVSSYFLKTFGRNQRRITCECERSDEPSMVQVLHISNGTTLNEKLSARDNRVDQLLKAKLSNQQLINEAYLLCLAREPTTEEMAGLLAELDQAADADRRVLTEDVFWSILSSREFLFNH